MKLKLTAILLSLLLVIALGACGKKTARPDPTVVVTDANGETVTDADGNAVTAPVSETAPAETVTADKDAPPEDAPIETIEDDANIDLLPAEPETPVELFNDALLELFTDEQKSNQWFSAFGMDAENGGVNVTLSMSQDSDSTEDAFRLVVSYYDSVRTTAQTAGLTLAGYEFTVLNDGATVGMYTTSDGVSYTATENGSTTQKTVQ